MKTLTNSLNNMRWNRILSFALPISILLFPQACAPPPSRMISTQPTVDNSLNYPLNQAGN
jgi:hypothetical protein